MKRLEYEMTGYQHLQPNINAGLHQSQTLALMNTKESSSNSYTLSLE